MSEIISYGGKILGFGNITPKEGIAYQRPILTGQITSYETGDDGWHLSAGTYDYTPPAYPVSYARLDSTVGTPFTTLVSNNAFGNKDRFTDTGGTQTYTGDYVIDHLTGLGWYLILQSGGNWATEISNANNAIDVSFSDWRMSNTAEVETIMDRGLSSVINYSPFNDTLTNLARTSTTLKATTTSAYRGLANGTMGAGAKTNTSNTNYLVRNHYT